MENGPVKLADQLLSSFLKVPVPADKPLYISQAVSEILSGIYQRWDEMVQITFIIARRFDYGLMHIIDD